MRNKIIAIGASCAVVFGIAGCSTEGEPTAPSGPSGAAGDYFVSLASGDSAEKAQAPTLAVPNSNAESHATNQIARMGSLLNDGILDSVELEVVYADEDVLLCFNGHEQPNVAPENFCFIYSNLVVEEGLLADFEVRGEPLEGQIALRYFEAIAAPHPDSISQASDFAVEGSLADIYTLSQVASTQATLDGGSYVTRAQDVVFESNHISLCQRGWNKPDSDRRDFCVDYSEFVLEGDRLVNFTAGDRPLDGRILVHDGEERVFGDFATVKALVSYESTRGDLIVVVEFTSTNSEFSAPYGATYLAANGRPIAVTTRYGPQELKPGRQANLAYVFAGASLGGDLELSQYTWPYGDVELSIPVK